MHHTPDTGVPGVAYRIGTLFKIPKSVVQKLGRSEKVLLFFKNKFFFLKNHYNVWLNPILANANPLLPSLFEQNT